MVNKKFLTKNTFSAKTIFGFEEILADELKLLGAANIKAGNRVVTFQGDKKLLYRANIELRTALRILKPILSFEASNEKQLYNNIYNYEWEKLLTLHSTFAIDNTVNSIFFKHGKYASLLCKDAIVDRFRKKFNERPSIDPKKPNLRFQLHISEKKCTMFIDSSGESLYKRGYRIEKGIAPLNEVMAAGMVMLSGWKPNEPLYDFFCGSGTILIEAALIAEKIPPNIYRDNFGFMKWKDFDKNLYDSIKREHKEKSSTVITKLFGSDIAEENIKIAKNNAERAKVKNLIDFKTADFQNVKPEFKKGFAILNPPYDFRIKQERIEDFYSRIGDHLKKNFTGFKVWILSGNKDAIKKIGLRTSKKLTLFNGPIESKFHLFELYEGSKKSIRNNNLTEKL